MEGHISAKPYGHAEKSFMLYIACGLLASGFKCCDATSEEREVHRDRLKLLKMAFIQIYSCERRIPFSHFHRFSGNTSGAERDTAIPFSAYASVVLGSIHAGPTS